MQSTVCFDANAQNGQKWGDGGEENQTAQEERNADKRKGERT